MKKKRLLTLLALLVTAATGAWATDVYLVGNGNSDGNWLNGVAWEPGVADNKMTEQNGVYSITFKDVDANSELLFKFAINGSWNENFGCTSWDANELNKTLSNIEASGNNIAFALTEKADVTISFNLSELTYMISTKGMKVGDDAASAPKHLITATYREQTRSLEQPLPYATTIGELYESVTGNSFSDLISSMSAVEMPLTGISSNNTSAVSIGELNGASTPVTVNADGKATISINFGSYAYGIFVSVTSPLYAYMKDGVKDADKWTVKVGEGEAQALPIGGLKGDGSETVTLQYNGRLKVKGVKATSEAAPAEEPVTLATPLTIEAITDGTIQVNMNGTLSTGMKYSVNGGTKTLITTTTSIEGLKAGDKVQFYGNGTSTQAYGNDPEVKILGSGDGFKTNVYGNIMSLLDETDYATNYTALPDAQYVFYGLFNGNTTLNDASELLLPATQLAKNCYQGMFVGCTNLIKAPALPATQLAANCYGAMFNGCSALTEAPVLPATQLVTNCYHSMFNNCWKLATVTCLATSGINQNNSTTYWLQNAGSQAEGTKTFNAVSTANWPSGFNGILNGWTRVNIDN